jgi:hypothetical protein
MRVGRQFLKAGTGREGIALAYAVFGTFVVASMVSVMFTMAGVSDRQADIKRGRSKARLLAEGALSAVEKDLQTALANWGSPVGEGTKTLAGVDVDFRIDAIGSEATLTDASGIQRIVQPYELATRTRVDGVVGTAHKMINVEWTPLFQFAVFYDADLEIHAGPDMTLSGRVHSNRDMYLGGGSTITMDTNYVRAVGGIYRSKKNGAVAGGNVDIRRWVENPYDLSEPVDFNRMLSQSQLGVDSVSGYDSAFRDGYDADGDGDFDDPGDWLPFEFGAAELWSEADGYTNGSGQTLQTGQHGVQEAVTPNVGSIAMYNEDGSKGYFHENAGLTIIVDGTTITVTDASGNDLSGLVGSVVTLSDIADTRQSDGGASRTRVIEINLGALNGSSYFPPNGLIYAAHADMGEGTEAHGVVLTNGSELGGDLTVASESPVYVHGDYNVVDKKAAAVIGDAVNLLSNGWDGTKAAGNLPGATETTFNFAMITGSYGSEDDRYNGGLENLPRFHENWSGVPCNISGSFVNIYDSEHATGDWQYGGDRYTAPQRNWEYDPSFNSVEGLPPFSPMAVSAKSVVTW